MDPLKWEFRNLFYRPEDFQDALLYSKALAKALRRGKNVTIRRLNGRNPWRHSRDRERKLCRCGCGRMTPHSANGRGWERFFSPECRRMSKES